VRCGKGAKDRYVPLPSRRWSGSASTGTPTATRCGFFRLRAVVGVGMSTSATPMPRTSVQDALRAALKASGLHKRASVHTFRHAWATPLLEAGVNLRLIQQYLGHNSPTTTAIYTHLTVKAEAMARDVLQELLAAL
jgi:integrase/recombinase XerD